MKTMIKLQEIKSSRIREFKKKFRLVCTTHFGSKIIVAESLQDVYVYQ